MAIVDIKSKCFALELRKKLYIEEGNMFDLQSGIYQMPQYSYGKVCRRIDFYDYVITHTEAQQQNRVKFADAVSAWQNLTQEQKKIYNVKSVGKHMSGYNYFISQFLKMFYLPKGSIIMWSGSIASIPSGFALCDGNNDTPDLRDKFVIGAKEDDAGVAKTNVEGALTKEGGEAEHVLTKDEMPSHRHASPLGYGSGYTYVSTPAPIGNIPFYTQYEGGGQAHNNLPPYYALAFIMKI